MRKILFLTFMMMLTGKAFAMFEEEPKISTQPIGTPFYRHLANDLHMDLRELVKFEKRGFGRTEICTLVLISSSTGIPLKEYGKRRLKNNIPLKQFADEAHLDYYQVTAEARIMKEQIEAKGNTNLPPPLYEVPPTPATDKKTKKEKKDKNKDNKNKETEKDDLDDETN